MSAPRYSLEPLAAAVGIPLPSLGRHLGLSGSTWQEARDRGVGEKAADRYAVRLGQHPVNVWEDWGQEAATHCCAECDVAFVPSRCDQLYCSKECRWRRCSREGYRRRYQEDPEFREQQRQRALAYQADPKVAEVRRRKARARYAARRQEAA